MIVTVWFLQSRNSIRDDERKTLPGCCGSGLMVMTIEPPPVQVRVNVFGVSPAVRPKRAVWLIACAIADMTADSAARLDVLEADDGEDGDWPPHPAAKLRPARRAPRIGRRMGFSSFSR